MKSTTGAHFVALDHVRALAALMVFLWHFMHGLHGFPIPFDFTPPLLLAPLALFDEGHTGVALFMTLSGYLFAKLLDGKDVVFSAFLWNRVLRLAPLLVVIFVIDGISYRADGGSGLMYLQSMARSLLFGALPNGAWSVRVEFEFYLVLPLLLWMLRRSALLPLSLLVAAIALRIGLYLHQGDIQFLSYWTLVGRIDQFVIGILAFQFRTLIKGRHWLAAVIFIAFVTTYWQFDRAGGYYNYGKALPASFWIWLPTIEAVGYGAAIAWYEQSFSFSDRGVSKFIGHIGAYSYSIYLLHFYWVFDAARLIDAHVMSIPNFYVALLWGVGAFLLMVPIGFLSYRFIESPFLRLRTPYIRKPGRLASNELVEPNIASS